MEKLHLDRIKTVLFLCLFAAGIVLTSSFANAQCSVPNGGQLENSLPSGPLPGNISELGDHRSHKDGSQHNGTDYFYPTKSQMTIPEGCGIQKNNSGNIIWEQNGKKSNGEPAGYGYYMMLDCGKAANGENVKIRIAHLPKNPYTSGSNLITQGCSGNAGCAKGHQHFHIEMIVGTTFVDSQCVWGIAKTGRNADGASAACKKCPNIGKANLCDTSTITALKVHSKSCKTSNSANIKGGETVDPNTIQGVTAQPDTSTGNPAGEDGTGMDPSDGTGGTGNTPIPDGGNKDPDNPDPPITPPDPDVPGTPGGTPNLVPPPAEGKEPEELSGCATDTWAAMVNQAVMETRREDILNKRFIVKPDTVLDYSCFDLYVKKTADDAGPIFSETKKWANLKVDLIGKIVTVKRELGSKSLDGALMDIVQSTAVNYRRGQFNNPHLAGSTPVDSNAGASNCDVMSKVWKAAKCKNFDDVAVFYTFEDLRTKEPREYPANMKCN